MPKFNPELVAVMRAALDETMKRVPVRFANPAVKVRVAECILLAAAQGVTNYDDLVAIASAQMQTILSLIG